MKLRFRTVVRSAPNITKYFIKILSNIKFLRKKLNHSTDFELKDLIVRE
jgi:hypothetical protein